MQYSNKREMTRAKIFDAYAHIIRHKRANSITVRDVCEEVGINRSTFYTYFKDIPDLEDALIEKMLSSAAEKVSEELHSVDDIDTDFMTSFIITLMRENENVPLYLLRESTDRFADFFISIMTETFRAKGLISNDAPIDEASKYLRYHFAGVVAMQSSLDEDATSEDFEKAIKAAIGAATHGPMTEIKKLLRK